MCSGLESRNCRILQLAGDTFSLLHIPDRHAIVWPRLLTLGPCTSCPRGIFLCLFLDFPCLAHRHFTPRRLGSSLPTRLLPSKVPPPFSIPRSVSLDPGLFLDPLRSGGPCGGARKKRRRKLGAGPERKLNGVVRFHSSVPCNPRQPTVGTRLSRPRIRLHDLTATEPDFVRRREECVLVLRSAGTPGDEHSGHAATRPFPSRVRVPGPRIGWGARFPSRSQRAAVAGRGGC